MLFSPLPSPSTVSELAFAIRENKSLYVIPLADKMEDPKARMMLGTKQHGPKWINANDTATLKTIVDDL